MTTVSSLTAKVHAEGVDRTVHEFGRVDHAVKQTGAHLSGMASNMTGRLTQGVDAAVGSIAPLIGVGGLLGVGAALTDSIKKSKDFETQMRLIQTQAGGTAAEVEAMSKGVLDMAVSVGTAPEALALGIYHIESVGIRGAKALDILKIAAEGAKVGGANLESVTNALTATVESGITGTKSYAESMGVLNAVVGAGNMRMEDLTAAMRTGILSTAKTFGVTIQSVGAALADMTAQGIPAEDGATRLGMAMNLMGAPVDKAAKLLATIGLGSKDLANTMRGPEGILGAITMLKDHLDKSGLSLTDQASLLSHAFGGGRSSKAIMTLLSDVGKLRDTQAQVNAETGKFGDAWIATSNDSQMVFDKFGVSMQKLQIEAGGKLLPVVTEVMTAMTSGLSDHSGEIIAGLQSAIGFAKELGGAIKTYVIPAIQAIAGVWNGLPKEFRDLLIAGIVTQKVSKFMLGVGPLDLLKGLVGGGVKAAAGGFGIGVQHVWVDNPGGFGGGGGVAAAEGAAGGGVLATLGGIVAAVAAPIAATAAVAFVGANVASGNEAADKVLTAQAALFIQERHSNAEYQKAISVINDQLLQGGIDGGSRTLLEGIARTIETKMNWQAAATSAQTLAAERRDRENSGPINLTTNVAFTIDGTLWAHQTVSSKLARGTHQAGLA